MTSQGGNRTVLLARKQGSVTIADVMRDRCIDMRSAYLHLRSVAGAGKLIRVGGRPGEALRWKAPEAKPAKSKPAPAPPPPPPTEDERDAAAEAARVLRGAVDSPESWGKESTAFLDLARPRRGLIITSWPALPGFSRVNGKYQHACLPGWQYTWPEVRAEMIPDLERLALHGERPTEATS